MESGSYNIDSFKIFIESKMSGHFEKHPSSILIMDNCRFYHRSDVLRILNDWKILYKFIPPYLPQLSPTEEFFGALKANYKMTMPRPSTKNEIKAVDQRIMEERRDSLSPQPFL